MKNNTFYIVCRENDIKMAEYRNPESFSWSNLPKLNKDIVEYTDRVLYNGWEFVDNIEIFDYNEAKQAMEEYRKAMPKHTVLIHCKRVS